MTRCLNCGADREADICEACGLNSTAAEFSLRKKLLNRTAIFLLGALAFVVASERYPALELDGITIFIGLVFFLTLALAIWVERRALRHTEVEALKRIYYGLIPLPWLLAGLSCWLTARSTVHHRIPKVRISRLGKFCDVWTGGQSPADRCVLARRAALRAHPRGPRRVRPLQHG